MDNIKNKLPPEVMIYLETKRHNMTMETLRLVEIMLQSDQQRRIKNIDGAIGAIETCIANNGFNMDYAMKEIKEVLREIARQIYQLD